MNNTPHTRRRCLNAFALGLLGAQGWVRAQAPAFPSRPITVVVPSQPGGGFDLIGRAIADGLGRHFGTGVVVENRTGSGTLVGTQSVAVAAADGYTLLVGGLSNLAFNAALYKNPRYDALTDFATIGLVGAYPYVLVVRADLPVNNYGALLQHLKAQPDKLMMATAGPGSGQHILAAAFVQAADAKLTLVPYRGAQAAYQDLLGGRIDLFIDVWPTVKPHIDSKRVRVIFTTGAARLPEAPQVPTVKELGLPLLEVVSWYGLFAPAKTPPPVLLALRKALAAVLKDKEQTARLAKNGFEPLSLEGEAANRYIKAEHDKWTAFIRQARITAD